MGLSKAKPRNIRGARADYSRQWHSNNEKGGSPEECGSWVHAQMQEEWGDEYASEIALEDCIRAGLSAQEKALKEAKSDGVDLLGDRYLEAPAHNVDGGFVKIKMVTSDYHDQERENEIRNQSRITEAFNRSEKRRKMLRDAGLWETKGMTTEQAAWKYKAEND